MRAPLATQLAAIALLVALIAGAFSPLFNSQFLHWDDFALVVNNAYLNPVRSESFAHFWTHPHEHLYTPLAYTLWSILATIFSPAQASPQAATAFHTLNITLHIIATVLMFFLLQRLMKHSLAALAGAAIFAVHPLQVEAVAWISGMNNVLAGAFSIAAMLTYVTHAQSSSKQRAKIWYIIATLCLLLALLSKPTAVVVPLLMATIDLLILRREARKIVLAIVPGIVLAAIFAVIARFAQPSVQTHAQSLPFRGIVALDSLAFYMGKLALPLNLCVDYGRTPAWLANESVRYFSWIVPVIVLFIAVWMFRRGWRFGLAGVVIFAMALLPILGLTPFDFQQYSTVADRYAYLAMIGVAVIVAGLVARWRETIPMAGAVVIALAATSFVQCGYWNSTLLLLERTAAVNPSSLMANRGFAAMLVDEGRADQARPFAEQAVRSHPDSPDARKNLAAVFMALNDPPDAVKQYEQALSLRPDDAAGHYSLAGALAQVGQIDRALEQAQIAVRLDPDDAQAHVNLGTVLSQMGRADAAIDELRLAVALAPRDARANSNLGYLLLAKGKNAEAMQLFRIALQANPNFAAAQRGLQQTQK
jgi:tetratricopeptide (TPR) repeat protein